MEYFFTSFLYVWQFLPETDSLPHPKTGGIPVVKWYQLDRLMTTFTFFILI